MIIDHPPEILMPFHHKYVFAMAMDMPNIYKVYECKNGCQTNDSDLLTVQMYQLAFLSGQFRMFLSIC